MKMQGKTTVIRLLSILWQSSYCLLKKKKKKKEIIFDVTSGLLMESQRDEFQLCSPGVGLPAGRIQTGAQSECSPYWNKLPLERFPSGP